MAPRIDTTTYDKAKHTFSGRGYSPRPRLPTSVLIHSTNNPNKNTFFTAEAKFLFEAATVSAHFLIGKDGKIVQFLDPATISAWHAGATKPGFGNALSIGIELHHSAGDPPYPIAQIDALTWLVRELIDRFKVPLSLIETHRAIALPKGRKSDPSDWSDLDFYRWRARLETPAPAPVPVPPPPTPDALRAAQLPGPQASIRWCSGPVAAFYAQHGGVGFFGYPLGDETRATGLDGRVCSYLTCERAVVKHVQPEGVHLALSSEARELRWF